VISDTVTLAYLELGNEEALNKAIELRPGDLYANYQLWANAQENGDTSAAATYRKMLIHFPPEALDPTDERLLSYAVRMIPELLDVGLWDKEKMLNVISYLVWQHNTSESLGYLLEDLISRDPNEPTWSFYLAELYHRQEQFDRARAVYQQVLGMDPSYAQAYLRLGMVSEAAGEPLSEAIRWYTRYSALAPDDLLGLRHLTETCTVLEETGTEMGDCQEAALRFSSSVTPVSPSESPMVPDETVAVSPISSSAVVLRAVLGERTDDHVIVAELLDLPVEDVELGPNLVENGEFEAWTDGTPRGWTWSAMFNKAPFQSAAFWGGAEDLLAYGGDRAVRVQGSWVGSEEEKSPARAGFWYQSGSTCAPSITITTSSPYAVIFAYSTVGDVGENATIWVTGEKDVLWLGDHRLSPTEGKWQHFVAVGWNLSETEAEIRPLIRLFAPGSFMVDNLQVSRISLAHPEAMEKSETKFLTGTR
jgi:tetratricopeptide (TPR) repeat protein